MANISEERHLDISKIYVFTSKFLAGVAFIYQSVTKFVLLTDWHKDQKLFFYSSFWTFHNLIPLAFHNIMAICNYFTFGELANTF